MHCGLALTSSLPLTLLFRHQQEPFLLEEIGVDFFLRVQLKTRKASAHAGAATQLAVGRDDRLSSLVPHASHA